MSKNTMFQRFTVCLMAMVIALAAIPTFSIAAAANGLSMDIINFNVIEEYVTDDFWLEISERDGLYYFFRDTAEYTLTMDFDPQTGIANMYRRDKSTNVITFESTSLTSLIEQISDGVGRRSLDPESAVDLMLEAEQLITSGYILLDRIFDVGIGLEENTSDTGHDAFFWGPRPVTDQNVRRELGQLGHTESGWAHTGHSLTQNDITAMVFQMVEFDNVNLRVINVARGVTITALGVLFSKPVGLVALVWTFSTDGVQLVTAVAGNANEHRVAVRYFREGWVFWTTGWAFQERHAQYDIIVGLEGRTASSRRWDTVTPNFFNTNFILQESIRMFRLVSGW